jgi:hypothetical protein
VKRLLALSLLAALPAHAGDKPFSNEEILGPQARAPEATSAPGFTIESMRLRFTYFDQDGHGYQSQAMRPGVRQPGSEWMEVYQSQLEVVATQGKFTHRVWVPVDIVSAASPDALDAISTASRTNEAASIDVTHTYHADPRSDLSLHYAFHLEEPFRSWLLGLAGQRSFADGNTVVSASLNQVFDWLDRFNIFGVRLGRAYRSSTNANLGVTQLLSPTTVGNLNYGVTVQLGELSNTWNAVPLSSGELGREYLPTVRHRHAFVGRLAQALPWQGALKLMYRFYVDSWGILAHTLELALYQRLMPWLYLRGTYRAHLQSAPSFWTLDAPPGDEVIRTADSDLAAFSAHTFGVLAAVDLPPSRRLRDLHLDVGYERYQRSNDLRVNIYTCSLGFRF